tara:strand:- start:2288 stop:2731 length:444 start_codon:yes stop_codon:yes gene_type:complete
MALIGKLINYDNHTDEFIEQEVTLEYPADLAEDHPDYDKRGTTEVVIGKTEVITEKTYDNVYVNINQVTVNRMFMINEEGNDIKYYDMQYTYWVYESREEYLKNPKNYIWMHATVNEKYEGDHGNMFEYAYNQLKKKPGFEYLQDDI